MKKKKIKSGAHAATSLAVWWTLFSLFAIFDWFDARRYIGGPDYWVNLTIWGIHLFFIGLALYAWHREKPREVLWVGDDDEILDIKPEEIDLEVEKAKLKTSIKSAISGVFWITIFAWVSMYFSGKMPGVAWWSGFFTIFGGILVLSILGSIAKFFILRHKVKNNVNMN